MANYPRIVVIVDGENLAIRYKAMLNKGYKSKNNITNYEKDVICMEP